ncbi:uncharacterized protein F5891DRAFT_984551 [Suillus fuscotomentosus]|uniref:Uncharacterized protein n=1 Tax=Suillus fuscotomentosus TaxID=1912939 RepID=A0AAD4DVU1_9AGAM|nr:uncharacterized protein F5891DRAFT_984551 [Suillus fuscotomentosus]KAG1895103.1 hypothetical protein F5891DRAFT_984551 [Suillus fuscotomentosus]
MPRPATCPGNANKHPGQEVIAAEKKKVSAEKSAKVTALDNAQKQVTAKEDAMAVEQMAQCAGPGPLVRAKPKLHPATKAVTAPTANLNKTHKPYEIYNVARTYQSYTICTAVGTSPASQDTNTQRKKYPGLKLTFKDGVNASRKVSNNGVASLSETRVGSAIDDGKFRKSLGSESSKLAEVAGVGKWARGVVSKSQVKPSAPPSAHASVIAHNYAEGFEDDDPPEDHDDSIPTSWGGLTTDEPRGRKRGLSTALTDNLEPEEQREMEEDQDADEDVQEDVDMTDQQGDIEMSVSVMEIATDDQTPKSHNSAGVIVNRPVSQLWKDQEACVNTFGPGCCCTGYWRMGPDMDPTIPRSPIYNGWAVVSKTGGWAQNITSSGRLLYQVLIYDGWAVVSETGGWAQSTTSLGRLLYWVLVDGPRYGPNHS